VYFSPGSYEVMLTVTDNQDRTDSTTRTVTVTGGPDSESEPNNDDQEDNTPGDADAANALPAFPFADYFGHVGPKPADGGDFGDPDDWYSFTLASAAEVDFYLELYDNVCDIDMRLYAAGDYDDYLASSAGVDAPANRPPAVTASAEPCCHRPPGYAITRDRSVGHPQQR
jgi:PKD repeat protein